MHDRGGSSDPQVNGKIPGGLLVDAVPRGSGRRIRHRLRRGYMRRHRVHVQDAPELQESLLQHQTPLQIHGCDAGVHLQQRQRPQRARGDRKVQRFREIRGRLPEREIPEKALRIAPHQIIGPHVSQIVPEVRRKPRIHGHAEKGGRSPGPLGGRIPEGIPPGILSSHKILVRRVFLQVRQDIQPSGKEATITSRSFSR